jgi:hypothetical protein
MLLANGLMLPTRTSKLLRRSGSQGSNTQVADLMWAVTHMDLRLLKLPGQRVNPCGHDNPSWDIRRVNQAGRHIGKTDPLFCNKMAKPLAPV